MENYLNKGVSPFHVVKHAVSRLKENGFEELKPGEERALKPGKGYYIMPYPSMLMAFRVNPEKSGMHIALAHTDSPSFVIKPRPEMPDKPYMRINVEPYGGMLMRTWFDRPLGAAGKVVLKNSQDIFSPEEVLFDSEAAWFIIPCLAPHLDRETENNPIDVQKAIVPVYDISGDPEYGLMDKIAEKLNVDKDDILAYDLNLYNMEKADYIGISKNMLSAPRIDNIASVAALTEGLIKAKGEGAGLTLMAAFNNEETGSRSKQGADSEMLKMTIEHIYRLMKREDRLTEDLTGSFMISADGAQGVHPNYKEKSDPTTGAVLGGGVVLKTSASQRYVTDSKASAVIIGLCRDRDIPLQIQANRSGIPGGQTLGPIASSYLPIPAADLGIPMLAMHSARELAHRDDWRSLLKLAEVFFA